MINKQPTISDIADAAGVSKTTVSRYINNRHDLISEATRHRIEHAIQLTGFHPNAAARNLRHHKTSIVVILMPSALENHNSNLDSLHLELKRIGYLPLICRMYPSDTTLRKIMGQILSLTPAALIMVDIPEKDLVSYIPSQIPYCAISTSINDDLLSRREFTELINQLRKTEKTS